MKRYTFNPFTGEFEYMPNRSRLTPYPGQVPFTTYGKFSEGTFSPNFGGLVGWFDAYFTSSITKDGSDIVSRWGSRATEQVRAVMATGANQPVYFASGVGGTPSIRFDGTKYMTPTSSQINAGMTPTLVFVGTFSALATRMILYGGNSANEQVELGTQYIEIFNNPAYADFDVTTPATDTPYLFFIKVGANTGSATVTRNGVSLASTGHSASVWPMTFDFNTMGARTSTLEFIYQGDYKELLIYNRDLTSDEITDLTTYLTDKWSL